MTEDQGARYDRIAEGYARHWAPVIGPAAVRLLDHLAPMLPGGSGYLLDIGTGTGTLAPAALERWPGARGPGIDASSEMVDWAGPEAGPPVPTPGRRWAAGGGRKRSVGSPGCAVRGSPRPSRSPIDCRSPTGRSTWP